MKDKLPAILSICLAILIWQVGAMVLNAPYILPTPIQILVKLWELREPLFLVHLPSTFGVTMLGLGIAITLGVGLAFMMAWFPVIQKAIYPLIVATQTIPTTAIAPLFVLWFGYSIWSRVIVTILITFFPITVAVYDGLQGSKREMEELLLTYGATKREIFLKLKYPMALPYFFSAIKMAIPISLIGAVVGEWLGAQSGLGYFSKRMMTQLDGAGVFAPIVLLSAIAMIGVGIITLIEKRHLGWRNEL